MRGPATRDLPHFPTTVNDSQHLIVQVTRLQFDEEWLTPAGASMPSTATIKMISVPRNNSLVTLTWSTIGCLSIVMPAGKAGL